MTGTDWARLYFLSFHVACVIVVLNIFMSDERTDRPDGYWQSYRDKVRAVTPEDVQAAANKFLHPDDSVILIVGPWDEIQKGNADSEADPNRVATMEEFFGSCTNHGECSEACPKEISLDFIAYTNRDYVKAKRKNRNLLGQ